MNKIIFSFIIILSICLTLLFTPTSHASPYGKGLYGTNVPYGSQTALSIATSGDITIPVTPVSGGTLATGTSVVTVTSTDVMGYKLYTRALGASAMNNLGATLPASGNGSPAALATNTWGYNTDASSNFVGLTLTDSLIRSITVPASTGDVTTLTYGIMIDLTKPAGKYIATVLYTAVPQTN
jgi:hypothetical protein